MKNIIETLYPMNACLLGEGYDSRLEFVKHLVDLKVLEFPSGTKVGTWTVPDEWIIRDAWVKFKGEKILDYKKQPLSVVVGSMPVHGIVSLAEFRAHLHSNDERPLSTPYVFKFYDKDWGFCMPHIQMMRENTEQAALEGVEVEGQKFVPQLLNNLEEGEYEVFIDSEYRPGKMKIGVHTIPGKSDREILLFAHLDHPYQANDNLSGVACLLNIATKIKAEHTVKIIFCPETIGSIAYALTQDISKVDFAIAVDICGNDNGIMLNKTYDKEARLNRIAHLAIHTIGEGFRKAEFRSSIGSDETVFNDPLIGIPSIMLSTWPYPEYHSSEDTPEKIDYKSIEKVGQVVLNIIEFWERDFVPKRNFKGPLMRSRYGIQSPSKQMNLAWDYFIYGMDGKKSLAELCCEYTLNFITTYEVVQQMVKDGIIINTNDKKNSRPRAGKKPVKPATKQK